MHGRRKKEERRDASVCECSLDEGGMNEGGTTKSADSISFSLLLFFFPFAPSLVPFPAFHSQSLLHTMRSRAGEEGWSTHTRETVKTEEIRQQNLSPPAAAAVLALFSLPRCLAVFCRATVVLSIVLLLLSVHSPPHDGETVSREAACLACHGAESERKRERERERSDHRFPSCVRACMQIRYVCVSPFPSQLHGG